jgi:hypothetical protein
VAKRASNGLGEFAAFILTNARPDRVITYETLRRSGYTGRIVLLVDDLDERQYEYRQKYGDEVYVFDKRAIAAKTDAGDNFGGLRGVVFARNAAFEVAAALGIRYFIALDDDYRHFQFRFDDRLGYRPRVCKNLDRVFAAMLRFYKSTPISSIAMSQGGDFIGGDQNQNAQRVHLTRKCMNSFFCSIDRPFKFMGRINEDVNAYMRPASTGLLFFTTNQISLEQTQTQTNAGGLTEIYLDLGTYVKSFYSVMYMPSAAKVKVLRDRQNSRLHHSIAWRNTTPMILREELRKPR